MVLGEQLSDKQKPAVASAGDCIPLNTVGESRIQYNLFEGQIGQKMVLKAFTFSVYFSTLILLTELRNLTQKQ